MFKELLTMIKLYWFLIFTNCKHHVPLKSSCISEKRMVLIGNNLGPFHYYTAILNFKQSFGSIILLLVPSI